MLHESFHKSFYMIFHAYVEMLAIFLRAGDSKEERLHGSRINLASLNQNRDLSMSKRLTLNHLHYTNIIPWC